MGILKVFIFYQYSNIFSRADQRGGSMRFNGHNSVIAGDSFINNFGKILAPKSPDV